MTKDLTAQKFGRLTAEKSIGSKSGNRLWFCRCECGATTEAIANALLTGNTRSCGCLQRETIGDSRRKHGMAGTRAYGAWKMMIARCYNPTTRSFPNYGGRGITVCESWRQSYTNFLADMGERPVGRTLDRINNDGPYAPANCRWATPSEQNRNKRPRKQ